MRRIGNQLGSLGLSESEVEYSIQIKRNATQEGYNKVVIITNNEATHVKGRAGDGIVSYPFQWDDELQGPKILGVDGRWNCHEQTPEECCEMIKLSECISNCLFCCCFTMNIIILHLLTKHSFLYRLP